MCSTRYPSPILMKLEFSRQFFEKFSNIKFHDNPYSGNRGLCGRTGTRDEDNSRSSQFCERVLRTTRILKKK